VNIMSETPRTRDPWAAYIPDAETPWDLRRVVHLHRRAGFGATWIELQRDLKDGPRASVDRLLQGKSRVDGVPADFAASSATLLRNAANVNLLKAWWVYRMLFGPDPLTERLALMWHNHFATSASKAGMTVRGQNEVFRAHARAPFGDLLTRVVHDPAVLLWLDAQANRKGHPNENLGRELMELFTLGIGHYTETDVKEAARALTGWTVIKDQFQIDPALHDAGEKVLLGKKGPWRGDDVVRLLVEHPATAERLAWRLCDTFLGEQSYDADAVRALAVGLRERRLNVGWAVETILRSRAFFAEADLGNRVVGPVEYVVGVTRALEVFDPSANTLILAEATGNLGQDLFYPPNVGGWPGGRGWITTRALIGRTNYVADLLGGENVGLPGPVDALGLARRHGHAADLDAVIGFYHQLFLGRRPGAARREQIVQALGTRRHIDAVTARRVAALVLALPEAQVA
jgi:uncharacterized protein (DUF1800 family)